MVETLPHSHVSAIDVHARQQRVWGTSCSAIAIDLRCCALRCRRFAVKRRDARSGEKMEARDGRKHLKKAALDNHLNPSQSTHRHCAVARRAC